MKKYNILIFLLTIGFAFSSCERDRAFPEFKDLEYGSFPRLIDGVNGEYDFFNIDGSTIDFTVEFYDEADGDMVDSYSWAVQYNGNGGVGPVDLLTVNKSEFGTSPDGYPSAAFSFGFRDVMDALGLDNADIDGGQSFTFLATLTRSDGKVFTRDNASANIQGQPTYRGMFQHTESIICPSDLSGTYDFSTVPWCGAPVETGQLELRQLANGTSYEVFSLVRDDIDFSFGAYDGCYGAASTLPGGDLALTDACGVLGFSGVSRWGEVYIFNSVTPSGQDLILDWENDYGEAGVTTLTTTDGTLWPPELTN